MEKEKKVKIFEDFIGDFKQKIEIEIKDPNRVDIMKFYKLMSTRGIVDSYRLQILRELYRIGTFFDKPFKNVTRDDMVDFVTDFKKPRDKVRGNKKIRGVYSKNSFNIMLNTVKMFFRWLYEMDSGAPPCVSWMKKETVHGKITEDDILTVEELKKMISVCLNDRDRAFLQVLFETGSRISGFLGIQRKDITFDSYGAIVKIKTEKQRDERNPYRSVRLEASVPILEKWMSGIPNDRNQFVWVSFKDFSKRMSIQAASYLMKSVSKRAGIEKNIHPHVFRHSSVTFWHAKGLPEGVLKQRVGWKPGSNMLNRYSHISDAEADNATLRLLGHDTNGNGYHLDKRLCPRCGMENELSNFCGRCNLPLNDEGSVQLLKEKEELGELRDFKRDFDKLLKEKLDEILQERSERIKS